MIELKLRTKTPVVHSFGETWLGETLLAFWTEHALLSPSRLTLESNEKFLLPWLPENSYQEENGEPGAIRTPDPQIRSLMLYPAELRVHNEAAFSRPCAAMQEQLRKEMHLEKRIPAQAATGLNPTKPQEKLAKNQPRSIVLGRWIKNSEPSASLRASSSRPPWPRTSSAAIARPRPMPPLRAPP
jgi:hypothetical protein